MESLTDEQLKETAAFKKFVADKVNAHSKLPTMTQRVISLGLSYDGTGDQIVLHPRDPRSHVYQFRAQQKGF